MLKEKLDKSITAVGGAKVKKHWLRIGLWSRPASSATLSMSTL